MTYGEPLSQTARPAAASESDGVTIREAMSAPPALFDHELVGVVLGLESPRRDLMTLCERIFELFAGRALSPVTCEEISSGCDLPEHEAARLSAAVELARRLLWPDDSDKSIRSPRDACRAAAGIRSADREHFLVLYLNARNVVIPRRLSPWAASTPT